MTLPRLVSALTLSAVALGAGASTAAAAGGLSISPAMIERQATPGALGQIRVSNGSAKALDVVVRARPWIQSRTGASRPNDSRQLSQIGLGVTTFKLAAGSSRSVSASLLSRPSSGSLYGTISVIGTPSGEKPKNGVRTRYRLLAALRLNPAAASRKIRVSVGTPRYSSGTTLLPVRNTGNTVEPITGTATVSGPSGTRRVTVAATRILPGSTVDLRLPQGRLSKGKYKVSYKLSQGGRQVAAARKSYTVK